MDKEKQLQRMYLWMTRKNHFVDHGELSKIKVEFAKNGLVELLDINRSIQAVIDKNSKEKSQRSFETTSNLMDLQHNSSLPRKRIHHNIIDYVSITPKYASLKKESPSQKLKELKELRVVNSSSQQSTQLLQTDTGADVYDMHIENYLRKKYESEMLSKYLNNKEEFIKQACEDINAEIFKEERGRDLIQQIQLGPCIKKKTRKRAKSQKLPLLMQKTIASKSKKSFSTILQAAYMKQLSQIKKSQEIQSKYRKRQQKEIAKRISDIQHSIIAQQN